MIYLDYAATTPVNEEVLDSFCKVTREYIGNSNSLHKLGLEAKRIIDASTNQIADLLKIKAEEIIYTSGDSESNNMAIKGICLNYKNRGKHIITTALEHSSVIGPLSYLQTLGFEVDFVKITDDGLIDLDDLKKLLRKDTILVTITNVNSEVGVLEDINKIGEIIKENSNAFFHSDVTQSIGKIKLDLTNVDLISFSAQKIYGIKGIGCLIKKAGINLVPLIHGGKSTTIYRGGTPSTGLIVSISKALRLAYLNMNSNYDYVCNLNKYLLDQLKNISSIHINSNKYSIPHIINISVLNTKPETMQHALEQDNIYISTKTACSSTDNISASVYAVTKNKEYASHSIRISLSHLTTYDEIDKFVKSFKKKIEELS